MATAHTTRPGGRTAHTTAAVYAAVREIVRDPGHEHSFAVIAVRSGVHLATLYRRWKTPTALILEVLVADLADNAVITATGDLHADLGRYANQLAAATTSPAGLTFLRALIDTAADPAIDNRQTQRLVQPRLDAYQHILDSAGTTTLTSADIVNHLLAPIYLHALLSTPLQPHSPALDRLVDHLTQLGSPLPHETILRSSSKD